MKQFLVLTSLIFISILSSAQGKKDGEVKPYPKMIKESSRSSRSQAQVVFKKHFDMKVDDELVVKEVVADKLGFIHEKFQQFYKKVKVEGAEYTVHSRNGIIEQLSGEFKGITAVDVTPTISAPQALALAQKHVGATSYAWDANVNSGYAGYKKPAGELVIIGGSEGDKIGPRLAWKFDVYAVDILYRAYVYVDAKTGAILKENQRIHNTNEPSSGTSLFNGVVNFTADNTGSTYRLRQTASGGGIETYSLGNGTNYANATDITSATSVFTSDSVAVQAHWGAERTYDYFFTKHNRNSYNNLGAIIKSYVHYSTNYVNAFWDGTRMTYGDGNVSQGYRSLVSLDICGHEITHGVTEYSANLTYSNESGALNESFSDIFGEAVENFAKGSNDWLMSCDIGVTGCGAFRSMSNPNVYGDPDTYKGTNWVTGTADNGGVHSNSGVQNKWFYILTSGESATNDVGNAYSVTGLGIEKASKIAYRNLTVYLSASSSYSNARDGAIQSAIDLYGAASPEVIATTDAWYAVGVGCKYGEVCYCASSGAIQSDEWIKQVSIGSFTNASTASSYTYFSGNTISLSAGSSYPITLTPGFTSLSYAEYWRIWIDYNNDSDFDDAGELVYDAGATSTTAKTGTLNISATATGTRRMRVSMKYNAASTPCEGFTYGEVEDYPVSFAPLVPDTEAPTAPVLSSPSNTETTISLSWTAATDNVGVTGYDVYVNSTKNNASNITALTYTISGLTGATSYSIEVRAKDQAANTTPSNTLIETTAAVVPDTQAPTSPVLSSPSKTQTSINLSWTAATDNVGVVGYDVYVNTIKNNASTITTRTYVVSGLTAGTTYSIEVRAKDLAGNTSSSNLLSIATQPGIVETLLASYYFPTSLDSWVPSSTTNCLWQNNATFAFEGSGCMLIQNKSTTASSPTVNLLGYSQVEVKFYFTAVSFENNEAIRLNYSTNSGSSYSTIATFAAANTATATKFKTNNGFYCATITMNSTAFTSTTKFRLSLNASDNTDKMYIDQITVKGRTGTTGTGNTSALAAAVKGLTLNSSFNNNVLASADTENSQYGVRLYPNPATNQVIVSAGELVQSIRILNTNGSLLKTLTPNGKSIQVDVNSLRPGTYIMEIKSGSNTFRKKFIKGI